MFNPTDSVVVVDDNRLVRDLVRLSLKQLGVTNIVEAENGADALSVLQSNPADLAILDWLMDGMDGLECTRRIRAGISGIDPNLPVILLTGNLQKGALKQAYEAGVDLFLEKPFSVRSLVRGVTRVMASENRAADRPLLISSQFA